LTPIRWCDKGLDGSLRGTGGSTVTWGCRVNTCRNRRVLTGASVAAIALVLAVPATASAAVPVHGSVSIHETFQDPDFCAAEGFTLAVVHDETDSFEAFFDRSGAFVRALVHEDIRFAISANGHTIFEHDEQNETFYADGSSRLIGDSVHIQGPGPGLVQHDAGQIVFNADGSVKAIHGPHPQFEGQTFCFALVP